MWYVNASSDCWDFNSSDMIGEDEAEASVPMHMSEVSEDTADDDLSSRYLHRNFYSLSDFKTICAS